MKKPLKKYKMLIRSCIKLFTTGLIQVYFVAINTVFLAKNLYLGVGIAAFMISMVWSYNVKKIVFGSSIDRVSYALGASAGSLLGLYTSNYITHLIQTL